MTGHVVFVTTELAPVVRGGAGSLVANLTEMLRRAGWRVTVLLVRPEDGAVAADGVIPVPHDASAGVVGASAAAARALEELAAEQPVDRVELQDFDGLAYFALAKRTGTPLADVPLTVRLHGPADLQTQAVGVVPPELGVAIEMERWSYRMADAVLVPTPGLRRLVIDRYGLDGERVVEAAPVVGAAPVISTDVVSPPRFVAVGRLGEVKGSHDLAVAAVPVLRNHPELRLEFIGADGWSASQHRPMRDWLEDLIPPDVRSRVVFTGHLEPGELALRLGGVLAVVAPSRFDSFNLAVHEARRAGLPVIVPDIDAFRDVFDQQVGALVYPGGRATLSAALERLAGDADLRDRLASAPAPVLGDPLAPYVATVGVRHERTQAGLSTAAGHAVANATPGREQSLLERPARAALRWLPEPLARTAIRMVPQSFKDRFRPVASWPAEQARRAQSDRLSEVRAAIATRGFPELDEPQVTVVIPCFNQGAFIENAVLSVFEQTMDSFEIIVVDDGSDDGFTARTLDALDWPRLRLIRQSNAGLPGARNTGIRAGRGQFVVPLDADDELAPEYLERMVGALRSSPRAAYAHCWAELFGDVEAVWATRPWNRYQILISNSVVGCVVLRRSAWEDADGYDETMRSGNEDWELWVRLAASGWDAVGVPEPLFRYRKHGVSMSVTTEARYEAGRDEVVLRSPAVYRLDALSAIKATEYPLVSVLGAEPVGQACVDREVVASVDEASGKYLVDWTGVTIADTSYLTEMVATLEATPDAGVAEAQSGPTVVRRWSHHDPAGPAGRVRVDVSADGMSRLLPGEAPDRSWQVPATIGGLPVQRQRPEVPGLLPEWVSRP